VIESGENGLLVPSGDDGALSRAMAEVLTNPQLRDRFSSEGRARLASFDRGSTFAEVERALCAAARLPDPGFA